MAPKAKHVLARDHMDRALGHLEDDDEQDAVNALFYAAEAALVALADANGIDTKRHHGRKADAAAQLFADGVLEQDYSTLLKELNQERKSVWYDGEPVDFQDRTMDEVAEDVEALVEAAEAHASS